MRKSHPLAFGSVHLLLTLSLPFVLLFLLSCKRAKEQKADLGPEVSADAINEALSKTIDGANLDALHIGEYLSYVVLRRIENADDVSLMGATGVQVIDAQDFNSKQTKFTLQINKSYRNDSGGFLNVASEYPLIVDKPKPAAAVAGATALAIPSSLLPNPRPSVRLNEKALSAWATRVYAKATPVVQRTTFHHLSEFDNVIDPPDKVRAKSDCGGLVSCRIPVHYIQFDLVEWFNDTDYQKISLQFGFSLSTPFLPFGEGFDQFSGILVSDCRSTYVQLETRNVYVQDCQQLDDFQK